MATIKGVWVFNNILTKPTYLPAVDTEANEVVSFRYYNWDGGYDGIGISFNIARNNFQYRQSGGYYNQYSFSDSTWQNRYGKTVYFGTDEQNISDDLYAWMQANAVPLTSNIVVKAGTYLSGTAGYVLQYSHITPSVVYKINFSSADVQYTSMKILASNGWYYFYYGDTLVASQEEGKSGSWISETYRTINLPQNETVDAELYAFLNEFYMVEYVAHAAVPEPEAPTNAVTIEYNGSVIASLTEGKATLPCKDKVMHTDIVVNVPELGGESVPEWDGSYTIESAVSLISFTIAGTEYQAEDGMTWAEWCKSEYNTGNVGVTTSGDVYLGSATRLISTDGKYANRVKSTTVIIADQAYAIYSNSGED